MRALITGSNGFVGKYLRAELERNGYDVTGLDVVEGEKTIRADILDPKQMLDVIETVRPDVIFHLAGQANVGASWKIPQKTVEINVVGAVNLAEAVRAVDPGIRMVWIGSSDQYGQLGAAGVNVSEDMQTAPQTPYAVSKAAQEAMAQVYVRAYGMKICMTRSFNHAGAGQKKGFMIPDFASGIADIERGRADKLSVGNLTARRDYTHVKDIVRAYRLIAEKGTPGTVYNVGSGRTWSAREILDKLIALADCPVTAEPDPNRMRPSETPVICCDHSRLTRDTGWEAGIGIDEILSEVLDEWRNKSDQEG